MLVVNKLDLESVTSNSKSSCHLFSLSLSIHLPSYWLIYLIIIIKHLLITDFVARPVVPIIDACLKHGGSFKNVDSCLAANLDFSDIIGGLCSGHEEC